MHADATTNSYSRAATEVDKQWLIGSPNAVLKRKTHLNSARSARAIRPKHRTRRQKRREAGGRLVARARLNIRTQTRKRGANRHACSRGIATDAAQHFQAVARFSPWLFRSRAIPFPTRRRDAYRCMAPSNGGVGGTVATCVRSATARGCLGALKLRQRVPPVVEDSEIAFLAGGEREREYYRLRLRMIQTVCQASNSSSRIIYILPAYAYLSTPIDLSSNLEHGTSRVAVSVFK